MKRRNPLEGPRLGEDDDARYVDTAYDGAGDSADFDHEPGRAAAHTHAHTHGTTHAHTHTRALTHTVPHAHNRAHSEPRVHAPAHPERAGGSGIPVISTSAHIKKHGSNPILRYAKLEQVGQGAYGHVYRACDTLTGDQVAVKRVRCDADDDDISAIMLREVCIIGSLDHENVVGLREVIHDEDAKRMWFVFDFLPADLRAYLDACWVEARSSDATASAAEHGTRARTTPELTEQVAARAPRHSMQGLNPDDLRSLTFQLLRGLAYCHSKCIIHRDLKPQNILISGDGILKIADFGLSRVYGPPIRAYTNETVTLWYRAPEILLGTQYYATAVDIWSAGCVFAEMASFQPLWRGLSAIDQLYAILRTLGTPTESSWPGVSRLSYWNMQFPKWTPLPWSKRLPMLEPDAQDLLSVRVRIRPGDQANEHVGQIIVLLNVQRMLVLDPSRRISAEDALMHPYFRPLFGLPKLSAEVARPIARAGWNVTVRVNEDP